MIYGKVYLYQFELLWRVNMAVKIIVDSGADFTPERAKALGIEILPIKTMFGDEEFLDGVNMSHEEFFEKLIESEQMPTTSQVAPFEYEEAFERIKQAGDTNKSCKEYKERLAEAINENTAFVRKIKSLEGELEKLKAEIKMLTDLLEDDSQGEEKEEVKPEPKKAEPVMKQYSIFDYGKDDKKKK